jgi:hypothetical protein
MAPFDDLPADQKAVLQLVLRQGRAYDDIAGLLKIPASAVRDRALGALDRLGPDDPGGLDDDRRGEIGDYLLGQQTASERAETRTFLEGSAPGRARARQIVAELRAADIGAGDALPDIPADPVETGEASDALEARRAASAGQERSSKLGGILLLGGLGCIVAIALLLIFNVFGGNDDNKGDTLAADTTTAQTASTSTTGTTGTTGTSVEAQINLTPPGHPDGGAAKTLGVANIASQDGQRALAVVGQNLPASGHYVLWLRKGDTTKFLGFFPVVKGSGNDKGRLQGLAPAPSDLDNYDEILVTRERSDKPTKPTAIVLEGRIQR